MAKFEVQHVLTNSKSNTK